MRRRHTKNVNNVKNLVRLAAVAMIAFPEPVTTVAGAVVLGFSFAIPNNEYRMAPCSGVIIRRGTLPRR